MDRRALVRPFMRQVHKLGKPRKHSGERGHGFWVEYVCYYARQPGLAGVRGVHMLCVYGIVLQRGVDKVGLGLADSFNRGGGIGNHYSGCSGVLYGRNGLAGADSGRGDGRENCV